MLTQAEPASEKSDSSFDLQKEAAATARNPHPASPADAGSGGRSPSSAVVRCETEKSAGEKCNGAASAVKDAKQYVLSPLRWRLLVGLCLFGICNGIANEHSVILDIYVASLEVDLADYMTLFQSIFFLPLLASFPIAALIERRGIKLVVYLALAIAFVRNLARMLLFSTNLPGWPILRWFYWTVQRCLTAIGFPVYYGLPLKVAESWFSESERSMALSLLLNAPIFGAATGALCLPRLVHSLDSADRIVWINLACLLMSFLVVGVGVRHSEPLEGPPSLRSQCQKERQEAVLANAANHKNSCSERASLFLAELARIFGKRDLVLNLLVAITFDQVTLTIIMLLQDIFAGAGLSSVFTGTFAATLTIFSISTQLFVSRRVRSGTRRASAGGRDPYNTRLCKTLLLIETGVFVLFASTLVLHELDFMSAHAEWLTRNQWLLVSASCMSFMFVKNCVQPYLFEQTAELISGLVSEANVSAWQSVIATLLFNLYTFIFVHLRQEAEVMLLVEEAATSVVGESDAMESPVDVAGVSQPHATRPLYFRSMVFVCSVAILAVMTYVIKFDTKKPKSTIDERKDRPSSGQVIALSEGCGDSTPEEPPGWEIIEFETTRL